MRTLRPVLAVVVMAAAVAFSLAGGAGSGSGATTDPCPPDSGRQFCVTITDTEPVSASVGGVVAYVLYTISVDNVGGATLTNGVVTTTLKDHVGTTTSKSSAQFIASASTLGCAAVSGPTNTVSCNVGNLAAGNGLASPLQLVYRTSTTTGVGSTDAEVIGSFKEKGNDNQNNDPNPDTRPVVENTPYESFDNSSDAWAPRGQQVKLGTKPDGDTWGTFTFTNKGQRRPDDARRVRRVLAAAVLRGGAQLFRSGCPHGHRRRHGRWAAGVGDDVEHGRGRARRQRPQRRHRPHARGGRHPGGHLSQVHERPADARRRAGEGAMPARLDRR